MKGLGWWEVVGISVVAVLFSTMVIFFIYEDARLSHNERLAMEATVPRSLAAHIQRKEDRRAEMGLLEVAASKIIVLKTVMRAHSATIADDRAILGRSTVNIVTGS